MIKSISKVLKKLFESTYKSLLGMRRKEIDFKEELA